jgi:tRNA dimethylallyltransferase
MPRLIAVMGETASGKTDLAEALADRLQAQLVNADAFQVYRGMDLGTAKSERKAEYELMDIRNPDQGFGVGEYVLLASEMLKRLHTEGRDVVVVGGSGLYIRALFERYTDLAPEPDPELRRSLRERHQGEGVEPLAKELQSLAPEVAAQTDLNNPQRVIRALERFHTPRERLSVDYPYFMQAKFAILWSKDVINRRIDTRALQMAQNGWTQEVSDLKAAGYRPEMPGFKAHGYREMWRVLEGEMTLEEAMAATTAQVRAYAKRQRTWLRSEPNLTTLPAENGIELVDQALAHLL